MLARPFLNILSFVDAVIKHILHLASQLKKIWYPSSRLYFKPHLASRIPHPAKPMLDPPRIPVRFTRAGFYRCSTLNVGGPIFMD